MCRVQAIQVVLVELLALSVKLIDVGIGGITSRIRDIEVTGIRRDIDAVWRLHLLDSRLRANILRQAILNIHGWQVDGMDRVLILTSIIRIG